MQARCPGVGCSNRCRTPQGYFNGQPFTSYHVCLPQQLLAPVLTCKSPCCLFEVYSRFGWFLPTLVVGASA